ncbi:MAG: Uma2 family endonuclease, partial [Bacteroidota bacterium]
AEYLELEKVSERKHEYQAGKIYAMTGGTLNHSLIGGNIVTALNNALSANDKTCLVANSDAKIFVEKANAFVYPDASVICEPPEYHGINRQAITNPILIVEVLSKTTGHYDRGEKFRKYCALPSFKEYVLIDQDQPVVDTLYRADAKTWHMVTTIGLEKSIELHSIACTLSMEVIYRNIRDLQEPQFRLDF